MQSDYISTLLAWNKLALDLVTGAERGPTITARYLKLQNRAIHSAYREITAADLPEQEEDRSSAIRHAISVAAYEVFTTIGLALLDDQFLENKWELSEGTGTGPDNPPKFGDDDSAAEQKNQFLADATNLLAQSAKEALGASEISAKAGRSAAESVIAYSETDGANQSNNYKPNQPYEYQHWIEDRKKGPLLQRPTGPSNEPLGNKAIDFNFLDEDKWHYNSFDPIVALSSLPQDYSVSEKGVLTADSRPEFAKVNPAVAAGLTPITTDWQGITNWGIYPTIDDGGTQEALTPHWGTVKPYAFDSSLDYKIKSFEKPYNSDGSLNTDFVNEARELIELSEELQAGKPLAKKYRPIAEYWEYGDGTSYPPGHWIQLSTDIVSDPSIQLGDEKATELFQDLSNGLSDAGTVGWGLKYKYNTSRPVTAINQIFFGSSTPDWEGNKIAQTDDRKIWTPYQLRRNFSPPFPDVPSGHSAFSAASAVIMRDALGGNYYPTNSESFKSRFSSKKGFDSESSNGNELTNLSWEYLSEQAEEAGFSRMLGGIHMRSGNLTGMILGTEIGHRVINRRKLENDGINLEGRVNKLLDPLQPELQFGTLGKDELTGLRSIQEGLGEVYGFAGDDVISYQLRGNQGLTRINLFGGMGHDHFLIDGDPGGPIIRIGDYELNESIAIETSDLITLFSPIKIAVNQSDSGMKITQVSSNGNLLFELDGVFDNTLLSSIDLQYVAAFL